MVMGIIHLVAPKANLLPLKAFGPDGTGFLSNILQAIYYAVGHGANAINMSFDFPTSSPELASALDYASRSALIGAASAGNDGQKADPGTDTGMVYPAALQNVVMGVASTGSVPGVNEDTRSSFSNYGNAIVWVAAPGEAIVTTYPFSSLRRRMGNVIQCAFRFRRLCFALKREQQQLGEDQRSSSRRRDSLFPLARTWAMAAWISFKRCKPSPHRTLQYRPLLSLPQSTQDNRLPTPSL